MLAQICDIVVAESPAGEAEMGMKARQMLMQLHRRGSRDATLALDYLDEQRGKEREEQQREEILATLRTSFHRPEELTLNMKGCLQQYGEISAVAIAGTQAAFDFARQWQGKKQINLQPFTDMLVGTLIRLPCDVESYLPEWLPDITACQLSKESPLFGLLVGLIKASALSSRCVFSSIVMPLLENSAAGAEPSIQDALQVSEQLLQRCAAASGMGHVDTATLAQVLRPLSTLVGRSKGVPLGSDSSPARLLDRCFQLVEPSQRNAFFNCVRHEYLPLWEACCRAQPPSEAIDAAIAASRLLPWNLEDAFRACSCMTLSMSALEEASLFSERFRKILFEGGLSITASELLSQMQQPLVLSSLWARLLSSADIALAATVRDPSQTAAAKKALQSLAAFRHYRGTLAFQAAEGPLWSSLLASLASILQHCVTQWDTSLCGAADLVLSATSMIVSTPNIWLSPVRGAIQRYIGLLVNFACVTATDNHLSIDSQSVLDVLCHVLDDAPPVDIVGPSGQHAAVIRHALDQNPALPLHGFLQLLLPEIQPTPASTQILATSIKAAVQYGHFQPASEKPWEWTPVLEQPPEVNLLKETIDPLSRLPNTGSLSLSSFGAVKLRDTIPFCFEERKDITRQPHDDAQITRYLESELTYGEGLADPAPARAARRAQPMLTEKQAMVMSGQLRAQTTQAPKTSAKGKVGTAASDPIELSGDEQKVTKSGKGGAKAKGASASVSKRKSSADLNSLATSNTPAPKRRKPTATSGK
jgi:hypothetical protein